MTRGVYVRTKEHKKNISEAWKGEKNYNWNGGKHTTYHAEARRLFGKNYCQKCGISRLLNWKVRKKDLEMHCVDNNYKNLNPLNWPTLCNPCHHSQHPKKKEIEK